MHIYVVDPEVQYEPCQVVGYVAFDSFADNEGMKQSVSRPTTQGFLTRDAFDISHARRFQSLHFCSVDAIVPKLIANLGQITCRMRVNILNDMSSDVFRQISMRFFVLLFSDSFMEIQYSNCLKIVETSV